jgi:hypothetical protein
VGGVVGVLLALGAAAVLLGVHLRTRGHRSEEGKRGGEGKERIRMADDEKERPGPVVGGDAYLFHVELVRVLQVLERLLPELDLRLGLGLMPIRMADRAQQAQPILRARGVESHAGPVLGREEPARAFQVLLRGPRLVE